MKITHGQSRPQRTIGHSFPLTVVEQSDTRFSPQVGAVYLVDDGMSVFASYGEGFRQLTGADFAGNLFDEESSPPTRSPTFGLNPVRRVEYVSRRLMVSSRYTGPDGRVVFPGRQEISQ